MNPSQSPAPTGNTLDEQLDNIVWELCGDCSIASPCVYCMTARQSIIDLFNATVTASKPEKKQPVEYLDNNITWKSAGDPSYNAAIDEFETALRAAIGGNNKEG